MPTFTMDIPGSGVTPVQLVLVHIPGTGKNSKLCGKCRKNKVIFGIMYDLDKTRTVYYADGTVFANDYPDIKCFDVCKECAPPGMYEKYYQPDGELRPDVDFRSSFGGA